MIKRKKYTPHYEAMMNRKRPLLKQETEAMERGDLARAAECRRQIDLLDPSESTAESRAASKLTTEARKQTRRGGGLSAAILQLVQGVDSYFSDHRKTLSVVAVLRHEAPDASAALFEIAESIDALCKSGLTDSERTLRNELRARLNRRLLESELPDWATLGSAVLAQQTPIAWSLKEFAAYLRTVERSMIGEDGALLVRSAARELAQECHERGVDLLDKCATGGLPNALSARLRHVCDALKDLLGSAAEEAGP